MKDKILIEKKMQKLIEITAGFCDAYLDEDYKQLCEKLIQRCLVSIMYHFFLVGWKFGQHQ